MVLAVPGILTGFNLAARAVCRQGEGILVQPPVYHPFFQVPEHTGAVAQLALLRQVNQQHTLSYEIDWSAFQSAFNSTGARTAMFLLCHPHNPTGQVYGGADLERMAELCLANDTVICSDEIHSELLLAETQHTPMAALDPEIARRTITLLSPSKTFNIVGFFCGFAIIPDAQLRARYRKVQEQLTLHVNSLGLIAAEAAFSGACDPWLQELRRYLTANRDFLVECIGRKMKGVRVSVPQATYLAWLDFSQLKRKKKIASEPAKFFLKNARVGLNPGAEFGPGGEGFVRLNFGCPRATLVRALEQNREALQA